MSVSAQHSEHSEKLEHPIDVDPELRRLVIEELDRVLASRFFKNSPRSRQFLEYIVRRKLEGRTEELKERSIGIELFQRPPSYATGEDPVVRVQAGEVRRRLERFYQAETEPPPVRIELPLGAYAPHFQLHVPDPGGIPKPAPVAPQGLFEAMVAARPGMLVLSFALLCTLIAVAGSIAWVNAHNKTKQIPAAEQFWAPALASQQPVLICLAKPVVYRPTLELYRRYSGNHPESFDTEVERSNRVLPLDPQTKLVWSEIMPYPDYGVAVGDVEAAVSISSLLGKLGKPTQVRIGDRYTWEDLHDSPSTVVGAFNNKWTIQIVSGLHFEFVENNGEYEIRENIPNGRTWHPNLDRLQQTGQDFAIVARLLDSNTGQFTVVAAGILGSGTQTAGDFVSKPDLLEKAIRELPAGWQNKNLEFVLQTSVTDAVAGPPSVVASYTW